LAKIRDHILFRGLAGQPIHDFRNDGISERDIE